MEKPPFENFQNNASDFIKNDYLNEYLSFFSFLPEVEEKYKHIIPPKTFSQKYPNMTFGNIPFTVSENEKLIINELDILAEKASQIISESTPDANALIEIAIKAAELCDRPDWAEKFKKCL